MTTPNPITPPPELVQQWAKDRVLLCDRAPLHEYIATCSAQWGADQELEACIHWLITGPYGASIACHADHMIGDLRTARRPKPPSLKEQALADFKWLIGRTVGNPEADARSKRILQALESLSDD